MIRLVIGAALLGSSALALAADPVAVSAIATSDWQRAEAQLSAQIAKGSREPGVLLNLAHVYRQTDRTAQAVDLYRQVQAEPNVQMERTDGSPAWSHDLARFGLQRASRMASR